MLINPDGSFVRDIDIDELQISCGDHYGKTIVLTKNKITYRNTIHPTLAYMSFPDGYFDVKEVSVSPEEFLKISDAIHAAGLLELFHRRSEQELFHGAIYQTLNCLFDDGAYFEYITQGLPDKEFSDIVQILLPYCDFPKTNTLPHQEKNESKITYHETLCCNAIVPNNWSFCPVCGRMLDPTIKKESEKFLDIDETMWLCEHCGEGVPMIYKYCGKCGRKICRF